jgi:hypothetical protein
MPGFVFVPIDPKRVVFTTSNVDVVSIADDRALTGVGAGEADVAATYLGMTRSVHVIVSPITRDRVTIQSYSERSANVVSTSVSVSVTVSYALVSAPAGELILQLVDQSQKTLASSLPSRVTRGGLMTVTLEAATTIPANTTSICTNVTLQSPNSVTLAVPTPCQNIRAAP